MRAKTSGLRAVFDRLLVDAFVLREEEYSIVNRHRHHGYRLHLCTMLWIVQESMLPWSSKTESELEI